MKNVQDWLDEKYSLESRESVKEVGDDGGNFLQKLFLKRSPSSQFTGNFDNFINFKSLTRLNLAFFQIGIESIESFPLTLESLVLSANSFPPSNLEPLRRFSNMKFLDIGYFDNDNSNFHNKWYGSLEPLSDMNYLEELYIESTDIDSGLEYLSKEIKIIDCKSNFSNSKCLKLEKILNLVNRDINLFCVDLYREEIQNKLIIKSIINDVSQGIKKEHLELKLKEFESFFLKFVNDYEKEKKKSEELENENIKILEEIKKIIISNNALEGEVFNLKFELKKSEDSKNKISEALGKELMLLVKDKKNIDFEKQLSSDLKKTFFEKAKSLFRKDEIENLTEKCLKYQVSNNLLISENEKLKKDNFKVIKENDKLHSENKKLYSLNEDFELTKNSLYKSKLKSNSLDSQLKIEKTKLSSILFINSIGKKLINLGLPFFKVDRFLEILQGGMFFSRLADKKEIESTGFLLIFLIFIIGLYELLKKLLKKFFKNKKNNSSIIKQVEFEEIYSPN